MRATLLLLVVAAAAVMAMPLEQREMAIEEAEEAVEMESGNPTAPTLSSSFHGAYSVFGLKPTIPYMPKFSNWLASVTHLLDGQVWQNIDNTGAVTIKTITTPTLIGKLVTPAMTQTWIVNHGWTEKSGKCTKDTANSQLVIPGDVLTKGGVFQGTQKLNTINPSVHTGPDGSVLVDAWLATLPNGEGTVTYYLLNGAAEPTPIMSHYLLKGKPPVWAQYNYILPGVQPTELFAPDALCVAASK